PCEATALTARRTSTAARTHLFLNPVGENRLPNFQNVDIHVERPVKFMTSHLVPSMDIFNLGNYNTIQALRPQQNATTANQISAVVAPRVIRFGLRVSW